MVKLQEVLLYDYLLGTKFSKKFDVYSYDYSYDLFSFYFFFFFQGVTSKFGTS